MGEQVAAGFYGGVAQLGEHLPCKQGVMSSNLTISIQMGLELSRLERTPDKREVGGSSPLKPIDSFISYQLGTLKTEYRKS